MEHADLLYSGLMFAAGMLSLWTALLLTFTFIVLAPSLRKAAPSAATISSAGSADLKRSGSTDIGLQHPGLKYYDAEKATPPGSLSQTLPWRSRLGRALRIIQ